MQGKFFAAQSLFGTEIWHFGTEIKNLFNFGCEIDTAGAKINSVHIIAGGLRADG